METNDERVAGAVPGWEDLSRLLPQTDGWMHSGMAIDETGVLYCAHPDGRALLCIDLAMGCARVVPTDFTELHGISLTLQPGVVAVADPGYRMDREGAPHRYEALFVPGYAAFVDAHDGATVQLFAQPELQIYVGDTWRPTSIDVNRWGISMGDVWVADGYGASLVHRYTAEGQFIASIDGTESGQRFDCPHAVAVRLGATGAVEVLVADRANHRIVVLDEGGAYIRQFGADVLDSPSGFAHADGDLLISELHGGVARFGSDDTFDGMLEPQRVRSHREESWPNRPAPADGISAPEVHAGLYNSPHGIAVFAGYVYVNEWLIGGRLSRAAIPN